MKLLCFGDSNTYGFDPRDFFGGRYAAADRWPEILAQKLGCDIVNEGINGRQIPRNPYPLRLLREHESVDILLVMLGTNDLLQGASAGEAAARMESFLKSMLPHFPRILLVSPPPMARGAWVDSDETVRESVLLGEAYSALAQKLGIPFVDTTHWLIPLAFDGVHFTEAGHHAFADALASILQPQLYTRAPKGTS